MGLFVVLVDVAVSELLPTQLTLVGLVFTVDDLVGGHLVQALEGATANLTGVRSLFRVCDHVTLQLIGGDEFLVTSMAVKDLMYLTMFQQVNGRRALPVTDVANQLSSGTS